MDQWDDYDTLVDSMSPTELREALKREARLRHAWENRWIALGPVMGNVIWFLRDPDWTKEQVAHFIEVWSTKITKRYPIENSPANGESSKGIPYVPNASGHGSDGEGQ